MEKPNDDAPNVSESPAKVESHECKFCSEKFDTLQLVLKHELLSHGSEKTPRKLPTNLLKRKVSALLKTINGEDEKKSRQELINALSACADGHELNIIFNKYQMNSENLMCIFSRVRACLEEELANIGEYIIEPFGSIVNGLALKTSDIDLHIAHKSPHMKSYNQIIFRDVTKMLFRSKFFTKVCPIRKARVPIIKCVHKATGFSLDINTSEPYGVQNSRFIRKLIDCDPRVHKLMLFLKVWCTNMHLSGKSNMSNYCLIALIIFYLQNSNPQVLASIRILQRNAQKQYLNGVNFEVNLRGFPMDVSRSVHTLIKGFFHFYHNFKFEDFIIAPYLGTTIKRDDFDNQTFIYPEYEKQLRLMSQYGEVERLRTNRPVCIQDAFCLNINVGRSLTVANLEYFKKCVQLAHDRCSDSSISHKDLYKYLLANLIDDVASTNAAPQVEIELPRNEMCMSFDIIPRRNELKSLAQVGSDPLLIRKLWAKEYMEAIVEIISEVYRIDMTLLSSTRSTKLKKFDENEKHSDPSPSKWAISCYVDLWSGRQIQRATTTPFMEYHLEQTKQLNAERRQDSNYAVQLKGYLNISIIKDYNALRVEVFSAEPVSKKDKLRKFFNAFKSIVQNYNLKQRIYQST